METLLTIDEHLSCYQAAGVKNTHIVARIPRSIQYCGITHKVGKQNLKENSFAAQEQTEKQEQNRIRKT
jgi:hypothetical protein